VGKRRSGDGWVGITFCCCLVENKDTGELWVVKDEPRLEMDIPKRRGSSLMTFLFVSRGVPFFYVVTTDY